MKRLLGHSGTPPRESQRIKGRDYKVDSSYFSQSVLTRRHPSPSPHGRIGERSLFDSTDSSSYGLVDMIRSRSHGGRGMHSYEKHRDYDSHLEKDLRLGESATLSIGSQFSLDRRAHRGQEQFDVGMKAPTPGWRARSSSKFPSYYRADPPFYNVEPPGNKVGSREGYSLGGSVQERKCSEAGVSSKKHRRKFDDESHISYESDTGDEKKSDRNDFSGQFKVQKLKPTIFGSFTWDFNEDAGIETVGHGPEFRERAGQRSSPEMKDTSILKHQQEKTARSYEKMQSKVFEGREDYSSTMRISSSPATRKNSIFGTLQRTSSREKSNDDQSLTMTSRRQRIDRDGKQTTSRRNARGYDDDSQKSIGNIYEKDNFTHSQTRMGDPKQKRYGRERHGERNNGDPLRRKSRDLDKRDLHDEGINVVSSDSIYQERRKSSWKMNSSPSRSRTLGDRQEAYSDEESEECRSENHSYASNVLRKNTSHRAAIKDQRPDISKWSGRASSSRRPSWGTTRKRRGNAAPIVIQDLSLLQNVMRSDQQDSSSKDCNNRVDSAMRPSSGSTLKQRGNTTPIVIQDLSLLQNVMRSDQQDPSSATPSLENPQLLNSAPIEGIPSCYRQRKDGVVFSTTSSYFSKKDDRYVPKGNAVQAAQAIVDSLKSAGYQVDEKNGIQESDSIPGIQVGTAPFRPTKSPVDDEPQFTTSGNRVPELVYDGRSGVFSEVTFDTRLATGQTHMLCGAAEGLFGTLVDLGTNKIR